jgi:hypothetical protein
VPCLHLHGRIVLLVNWHEECVQNFSEKYFWKNIIWKNGKKWKGNIMISIGKWVVRIIGRRTKIDEILWRTFKLEVLNLSTSVVIITVVIIITTAVGIKCVDCE